MEKIKEYLYVEEIKEYLMVEQIKGYLMMPLNPIISI